MNPTWTSILFHIENMSVAEIIVSLVDIALIAYLLFRIILLIRGTRAIHLVQGVVILVLATVVSGWLNLSVINWLLEQARLSLLIAIPIVFQPELRRALEKVGRGKIFWRGLPLLDQPELEKLIEGLGRAIRLLSRNKVGALIVLERETGLDDFAETGIAIDARVSPEFLVNVFIPNTPLHDGAVIIRGNRVVAAACFLPLTEAQVDPKMGGRHRAALGVTEQTDAVAVVVSEETGSVSLARDGKIIRNLDGDALQSLLEDLLLVSERPVLFSFLQGNGGGGDG
ncbi:MAG: diadenylate cyclase CdaA [Bacillota bacterium]